MLSWFAFLREGPLLEAGRLDGVAAAMGRVPGVTQALVFSPVPADTAHPYAGDGPGPRMAVQLNLATIEALEAALAAGGPLAAVFDGLGTPIHQAMLRRRYPVPDATLHGAPGERPCSYLVHYPGEADDPNAWHAHYNTHHPPIMARFPGVRLIEIYTRIDWVSGVDWPRENAMQRNKLMFDSPAALSAGLAPEVMAEMRADFGRFPPFRGGNAHYAFETRIVP